MDTITKAYAYNQTVRIYVATTTQIVSEAQRRHKLWPTSTAALGRVLTIGAIMGLTYKGDEELMIKVNGNGPIGDVVCNSNALGEVSGYVSNPEVFMEYTDGPNKGKLNVSQAVGVDGYIHVTKNLKLRDMFTSSSLIQTGEIAEDFTYYFAVSEQIPSSVGLGVLVDTDNTCIAAGGFLLQLMPGCKEESIVKIEEMLKTLRPMSEMIAQGLQHEDIMNILSCGDYQILENTPIKFKCQCSKEKFARGLASIDKKTLKEIIEEDQKAETVCHFCNEVYNFSKEELEEIYNEN